MSETEARRKPAAKAAREMSSRLKVQSQRPPAYLWGMLCAAEEHVGWDKNAVLHRIVLRKVDGGWQALIKASRGMEKGIAYVNGRSLGDCLELVGLALDDGSLVWKRDHY